MARTVTTTPAVSSELPIEVIERRIYFIRGHKVMIDSDLAALYQVPTKRLNEAVRRNPKRFPADFVFQLTAAEHEALRSQNATSNAGRGGRRYLPNAFTEQGVAMLSSVLASDRAIMVNIAIMRTFVRLREVLANHKVLAIEIEKLKREQRGQGQQIEQVFAMIQKLLEPPPMPTKRRIGFRAEDSARGSW